MVDHEQSKGIQGFGARVSDMEEGRRREEKKLQGMVQKSRF